jgi:protein involved in polysaccharide export with SLBB domain
VGISIVTVLLMGCRSFEAEPQFSHAPAFSTDESQDINDKYVFQRGDLVTIVFQGLDQPFLQQRIQEDGTVLIPSLGSVFVEGCTAKEIQKKLAVKHSRLHLHGGHTCIYYVTGEVNTPGPKAWYGQVAISQAIQAAGGFTEAADTNRVTLQRANGKRETIRLRNSARPEAHIFHGDSVHVRRHSGAAR